MASALVSWFLPLHRKVRPWLMSATKRISRLCANQSRVGKPYVSLLLRTAIIIIFVLKKLVHAPQKLLMLGFAGCFSLRNCLKMPRKDYEHDSLRKSLLLLQKAYISASQMSFWVFFLLVLPHLKKNHPVLLQRTWLIKNVMSNCFLLGHAVELFDTVL